MANFTAGTSFTDGVTNDVTAAKLNALVADAVPTSNLSLNSTTGTIANFTASTANITLGTIPTLTAGTTTGTAGVFTSGTITTLNSTTPTFLGAITASTNTINVGSGQIYKDASGNVGIGTASPTGKLDVNGGNIVNTTTAAGTTGLSLSNGTAGAGISCDFSASNTYLDINSKLFIRDSASAFAARMNIDSSGNVGIGTASPACKLNVETSAISEVVRFQSNVSGDVANSILNIVKKDNDTTTSQLFVQFLINNFATGSGRINANGANAAAFGSYSDSRLKENITELPSQLANICLLKPSEFDYKNGSGHQIGFIAQEMQEVYPDAVGVGDDGMLTITAWSKTEARLVKAIQELKAKNDSLEARLQVLESKVTALEAA